MRFANGSKRKLVFAVLSVLFAVLIFCLSARNAEESTEDSYAVGMEFGRLTQDGFSSWPKEEQLAFAASVDHPIRKLAHATEYALFAMLLCGVWADKDRRRRLTALYAWLIATVYAMTDEFHQLFVPGRSGQFKDVLIDSGGAAVGVGICMLVLAVIGAVTAGRKRRNTKNGV